MVAANPPHSSAISESSLLLSEYLNPHHIFIVPGSLQKEAIFNDLIYRLAEQDHLMPQLEKLQKALWDREHEGRTVLENGLAIPHARIAGLESIRAVLALMPEGYEDPDEHVQVKILFLFYSPQEEFRSHLQLLARISRVFQDKQFVDELLSSPDSLDAFQRIQKRERESL